MRFIKSKDSLNLISEDDPNVHDGNINRYTNWIKEDLQQLFYGDLRDFTRSTVNQLHAGQVFVKNLLCLPKR